MRDCCHEPASYASENLASNGRRRRIVAGSPNPGYRSQRNTENSATRRTSAFASPLPQASDRSRSDLEGSIGEKLTDVQRLGRTSIWISGGSEY
ncbi:hypothetical protein CERSUDRAFT_85988 [Gelatoporia subvermispora B]|uniref:Uncharacterized protein n=1 Tax=Ceriporiopsis subvermispora (strain B) TaxID=914234 RepID=M2PF93_CERS8|nr:hypothetical protein CERSUDRAFT_85988 [Gelatoporia subvermispora B]